MNTLTIQLTDEQIAQLRVDDDQVIYSKERPLIEGPKSAAKFLKYLGSLKKEHFVLLTLDGANRVINRHSISTGTLTSSLVHPREVFRPAIIDNAASIIIAHNHPSGSLNPSTADLEVTKRLEECGTMLGISVVDHLIITKDDHASII